MSRHFERFVRWMGLQNYSSATQKEYIREIERFHRFLEGSQLSISEVEMADVEDYIISLQVAEMAKNRAMSALRTYFRYQASRGMIAKDPTEKLKSIKVKKKNPVFLTQEEYMALMETIHANARGFMGLRDQTIVALFLSTGARVSELIHVRFQDLQKNPSGLYSIEVLRKGQEMDYVFVNRQASELLDRYLSERKGQDFRTDHIFLSKNGNPLDRTAAFRLIQKYLIMSGIQKKKMGPHVLRHTFATTLMRKNVSLFKIKELMNHKNLKTTERYLHVVEDDLRKAVEEIEY